MKLENYPSKMKIKFARGAYGEILPPFSLAHLQEILANNCKTDLEAALYQAVMVEHQPLALPSDAEMKLFAPVLTHLPAHTPHRWRIGVLGEGRMATIEELDAAQALRRALLIVETWQREEEENPGLNMERVVVFKKFIFIESHVWGAPYIYGG